MHHTSLISGDGDNPVASSKKTEAVGFRCESHNRSGIELFWRENGMTPGAEL